jgi:hypothetical protein
MIFSGTHQAKALDQSIFNFAYYFAYIGEISKRAKNG